MADYVTRVALADHRLGVAMMALVCPKPLDVTVHHEPVLVSVEDLDRSLNAAGLPSTAEVFKISYDRGPVEDIAEAELVAEEVAKK